MFNIKEIFDRNFTKIKLSSESGFIRKKFLIIITLLLTALTFCAIPYLQNLYETIFDKNNPNIELSSNSPKGLGQSAISLSWKLHDANSGLYEATAVMYQKDKKFNIAKKLFSGQHDAEMTFSIDAKKIGLQQGNAELKIKVFDKSFFFNASEQTLNFIIDYTKPKLQTVTTQHNANLGGSQLIIYETSDPNLTESGIEIGKKRFKGFPADLLDPAFKNIPNLYACLYSIPLSIDIKTTKPFLFASDIAGNTTKIRFYNKVAKIHYSPLSISLSKKFVEDKIANFLNSDPKLKIEFNKLSEKEQIKFALNTVRSNDIRRIQELLSEPKESSKLFEHSFMKPNNQIRSEYGHILKFLLNNELITTEQQLSYRFSDNKLNNKVMALNSGTVFFVGNIGSYGNTVIIKHGIGLFSLYANLSTIFVNKGDNVFAGQNIALTGDSGLAFNNGMTIEFWLQNSPVNPREWWDNNWFQAHITQKIKDTKSALGINTANRF